MAFLTSVLRWPDRALANDFVNGFHIIGKAKPSNIFRHIDTVGRSDLDKFYGQNAIEYVREIIATKPPKDHKLILEMTLDEIKKGHVSDPMTAAQLDAKYGKGQLACASTFHGRSRDWASSSHRRRKARRP